MTPLVPAQEPLDDTTNETSVSRTPAAAPDPATPIAAGTPAPGDTVGTGSVIALGCIGGTLFLIVIGLIFLLAAQIFG